jgi:hypothetical protein
MLVNYAVRRFYCAIYWAAITPHADHLDALSATAEREVAARRA